MPFTLPWPILGTGTRGTLCDCPSQVNGYVSPSNAPWVGGHHCATGDNVWTVPTSRVSTDLTWGPRAEQSHMDVDPMLSSSFTGDLRIYWVIVAP